MAKTIILQEATSGKRNFEINGRISRYVRCDRQQSYRVQIAPIPESCPTPTRASKWPNRVESLMYGTPRFGNQHIRKVCSSSQKPP